MRWLGADRLSEEILFLATALRRNALFDCRLVVFSGISFVRSFAIYGQSVIIRVCPHLQAHPFCAMMEIKSNVGNDLYKKEPTLKTVQIQTRLCVLATLRLGEKKTSPPKKTKNQSRRCVVAPLRETKNS